MKLTLDLRHQHLPKVFWLALVLLSLYVIVSQLPASWLSGSLTRQTDCRVMLEQPLGTIWQGSAALAFSEPNASDGGCRDPMSLTERFHWASSCQFLGMTCTTEIQFASLEKPQRIEWHWSGVNIAANEIKLPANVLEGLGNPWSTLRPRGQLDGHWTQLQFGGLEGNSGVIRIIISKLTSPISPVKPLGSYEIQANLSKAGMNWLLSTSSGPLLLKGQGEASADGTKLQFAGEAWAAPETQESLIGLLSLLGKKEGDVYRLKF